MFLLGEWKRDRVEGIDEFLRAVGVGPVQRKIAASARPVLRVTRCSPSAIVMTVTLPLIRASETRTLVIGAEERFVYKSFINTAYECAARWRDDAASTQSALEVRVFASGSGSMVWSESWELQRGKLVLRKLAPNGAAMVEVWASTALAEEEEEDEEEDEQQQEEGDDDAAAVQSASPSSGDDGFEIISSAAHAAVDAASSPSTLTPLFAPTQGASLTQVPDFTGTWRMIELDAAGKKRGAAFYEAIGVPPAGRALAVRVRRVKMLVQQKFGAGNDGTGAGSDGDASATAAAAARPAHWMRWTVRLPLLDQVREIWVDAPDALEKTWGAANDFGRLPHDLGDLEENFTFTFAPSSPSSTRSSSSSSSSPSFGGRPGEVILCSRTRVKETHAPGPTSVTSLCDDCLLVKWSYDGYSFTRKFEWLQPAPLLAARLTTRAGGALAGTSGGAAGSTSSANRIMASDDASFVRGDGSGQQRGGSAIATLAVTLHEINGLTPALGARAGVVQELRKRGRIYTEITVGAERAATEPVGRAVSAASTSSAASDGPSSTETSASAVSVSSRRGGENISSSVRWSGGYVSFPLFCIKFSFDL